MAITGLGADLLLSYAQSRTLLRSAGTANASANAASSASVKAPWESSKTSTPADTLVTNALSGRAMFDASSKKFSTPGLSADGRKLFALHAGVNTLAALASRYEKEGVSDSEKARLEKAFEAGLKQLDTFLAGAKFADLSMVRGALMNSAISKAVVAAAPTSYTTAIVARGDPSVANAAFEGNLAFTIDAKNNNGDPVQVQIDLNDMGSTPRSLNSVVAFLNQQLTAAGLSSKFETALQKEKLNGQDQFALKLKVSLEETFSFSAATTAPAMYVLGGESQLLKFSDTNGTSAPAPVPGDPGWVQNRVLAKSAQQGEVRASATGPDGSLYVLANVTTATNQPVKGAQDVALFKYDSAGQLVFTRTLGAAQEGAGFALAVDANGQVAVAGSVKGGLAIVGDDVLNTVSTGSEKTGADSFVTLFNADGEEAWTARDGADDGDDQATAIAFGANGELYVGGRAKDAALDGQTAGGGWDGYLRAYDEDGLLRSTQQFGGADDESVSAIAVEDIGGGIQRVTLAGAEAGKLILRQFSDDGLTVATGSTRDLGSLGGGNIIGLTVSDGEIYIAGNTKIGGLNAGTIAQAYGGGQDGFVAKLSGDLVASGGDRVSYIGGSGEDSIAGFGVSGGEIWLGGDSKIAFGGASSLGTRDGFIAKLDTSGALASTQRFTEKDQDFSMKGFAFKADGVSALDRLGLPTGPIDLKDSTLVTARTSLRAGDEFSISVNGRTAQKVVVKADDTMATLAERVEKILLSDGAGTSSVLGGAGVKITASAGDSIRIISGPDGKDALAGLGLSEGVVRADPTGAAAKKKAKPAYGLGIDSSFDISSALDRKLATQQFGTALSAIQKAYKTLTSPASTTTPTGPAPAYLQAQIANYQAALARLGGGS